MTPGIHPFAVQRTDDGKFHLLFDRKTVEGVPGYAAWRYSEAIGGDATPFASEAEARAFAKDLFGASDEDFAADPGRP